MIEDELDVVIVAVICLVGLLLAAALGLAVWWVW